MSDLFNDSMKEALGNNENTETVAENDGWKQQEKATSETFNESDKMVDIYNEDKEKSILEQKCEYSSSHYDSEKESEPQAGDFVRLGNIEVLLFIQEKSRLKNEKEIDLSILRNTYKEKSESIKAKYLESEDIKELGTGKERESVATKRMNDDENIIGLNSQIKTLENSVRNIGNEINLAEKIFKLKNYNPRMIY